MHLHPNCGSEAAAGIWLRPAAAIVALALTSVGVAAQPPMAGAVNPLGSARLAPDPDVACLQSALESGDPANGPSTWILKAPGGCVVPWHWHTAQEQLMVVEGSVLGEMTGHPSTALGPGGFAMMPGRTAHQFTCQPAQTCLMFVTFDGPYDIKWGKGPPR